MLYSSSSVPFPPEPLESDAETFVPSQTLFASGYLESEPAKVHARAYDLVMNGNEIAGGSMRIFNSELQAKMFAALGISVEEAKEKFGFLMNAFQYGAPPHGGIAFGLDRMVMLFTEENSIRDLIAFPKTTSGLSLMDEAPSKVSEEQLRELHVKLRK